MERVPCRKFKTYVCTGEAGCHDSVVMKEHKEDMERVDIDHLD